MMPFDALPFAALMIAGVLCLWLGLFTRRYRPYFLGRRLAHKKRGHAHDLRRDAARDRLSADVARLEAEVARRRARGGEAAYYANLLRDPTRPDPGMVITEGRLLPKRPPRGVPERLYGCNDRDCDAHRPRPAEPRMPWPCRLGFHGHWKALDKGWRLCLSCGYEWHPKFPYFYPPSKKAGPEEEP